MNVEKQLGFGCVRLTSNYSKKQAIRNLEIAYEHGITHFDAARLYGFGLAEGILGEFAKNKRDHITITSKFGLSPNNVLLKNLVLQNVLRMAYRFVKGTNSNKNAVKLASTTITPKDFSIENANKSLATTLRELKTDYIDYYLLHEATVDEAANSGLIQFLEEKKSQGLIREFGIASFSNVIENKIHLLKPNYNILQTSNSFPFQVPSSILTMPRFTNTFHFSPFQHLNRITELLKEDASFNKQISDLIGFSAKENSIKLFLMHQFYSDVKSTTLFTSNKNDKIISTIKTWQQIKAMDNDQFCNFIEIQQLIESRLLL